MFLYVKKIHTLHTPFQHIIESNNQYRENIKETTEILPGAV